MTKPKPKRNRRKLHEKAGRPAKALLPSGRPIRYELSVADEICDRISKGEMLRNICNEERMPHFPTVYAWAQDDAEFGRRLAEARRIGCDAIAAQTIEIADTPEEGVEVTISDDKGKTIKKADMLGHRKLRVETRRWLISKWAPDKYGDAKPTEVVLPREVPLDQVDMIGLARKVALLLTLASRKQDAVDA